MCALVSLRQREQKRARRRGRSLQRPAERVWRPIDDGPARLEGPGLRRNPAKVQKLPPRGQVDQIIHNFDAASEAIAHCQKVRGGESARAPPPAADGARTQCYEELLSKFSGSASLHLEYANFCEAVLNDQETAAKYRHGAEILESGGLRRRGEDLLRARLCWAGRRGAWMLAGAGTDFRLGVGAVDSIRGAGCRLYA